VRDCKKVPAARIDADRHKTADMQLGEAHT
jgi:hypothetical protein